ERRFPRRLKATVPSPDFYGIPSKARVDQTLWEDTPPCEVPTLGRVETRPASSSGASLAPGRRGQPVEPADRLDRLSRPAVRHTGGRFPVEAVRPGRAARPSALGVADQGVPRPAGAARPHRWPDRAEQPPRLAEPPAAGVGHVPAAGPPAGDPDPRSRPLQAD